jgi:hypothetical protein
MFFPAPVMKAVWVAIEVLPRNLFWSQEKRQAIGLPLLVMTAWTGVSWPSSSRRP